MIIRAYSNNVLILKVIYMLGAKYGFGLFADLLRKPVICALRANMHEVHADNPRIVLSNAQTFTPRSAQQIRGSRRQSSDGTCT